MGLSSAGVGSGLDVTSLVTSLMAAENKPLVSLNAEVAKYTTKISSLATFKNNLATFQATAKVLTDSANFQTISASASDSSSVTGSLSSGAVPGNFSIEVNQLAKNQKLVSTGITDANAIVGAGTITFNFGSITGGSVSSTGTYTDATFAPNAAATKTVTIDSSNNTLAGISVAINAADMGVTATIINDGSNAPNRLILTNTQTGQAQSMSLAVTGDAGLSSLLSYDPSNNTGQAFTETSKAQDAKVKVDGIVITNPKNSISGAIPGVSLVLHKINTGTPTQLSLTRNVSNISSNLNNFISGYNSLIGTIASVTAYDQTTHTGASLFGESSLRAIKNQIRSTLSSLLPNTTGFTSLSQLGVSFQKDGTLTLDSTKFNAAVTGSYDKIGSLFTEMGTCTDSQLSYTSVTTATKTGSYAVNIDKLATQGTFNGSAAANLTITAGINDTLQVTLDNLSSTVTLSPGIYCDANDLAKELQAKINTNTSFKTAGASVLVSTTYDGIINVTSNSFGLMSKVMLTGKATPTILGGTGILKNGTDMIGSINGVKVSSNGQYLIGAKGDPSEGLAIKISGDSIGSRGTVSYTQGIAFIVNQLIDSFTATSGPIDARTSGLKSSIKTANDKIASTQIRLSALQVHYQAMFSSLDNIMTKMTATSTYLTAQFEAFTKSNSNNN